MVFGARVFTWAVTRPFLLQGFFVAPLQQPGRQHEATARMPPFDSTDVQGEASNKYGPLLGIRYNTADLLRLKNRRAVQTSRPGFYRKYQVQILRIA